MLWSSANSAPFPLKPTGLRKEKMMRLIQEYCRNVLEALVGSSAGRVERIRSPYGKQRRLR